MPEKSARFEGRPDTSGTSTPCASPACRNNAWNVSLSRADATGLHGAAGSAIKVISSAAADVCLWPEADVTWAWRRVRFPGESGHDADWLSLPSLTQSEHRARAKRAYYLRPIVRRIETASTAGSAVALPLPGAAVGGLNLLFNRRLLVEGIDELEGRDAMLGLDQAPTHARQFTRFNSVWPATIRRRIACPSSGSGSWRPTQTEGAAG